MSIIFSDTDKQLLLFKCAWWGGGPAIESHHVKGMIQKQHFLADQVTDGWMDG
jgi:hypothetical protein